MWCRLPQGERLFFMRLAVALLMACLGYSQTPRLTFEVASIKPAKPGGRGGGIKPLPGGQEYRAQAAPVKLMISLMYKIPIRQISGGPDWLNTDLWDIEAKAEHTSNIDDLHTMFQNLLTDEFKLKFHKEIKEGPVYALMVDKSGSKMKVNESPQDFEIPIGGGRGGMITGKRVPMQYLTWWLGQILQNDTRPVIDKTGLDKNYDFTLAFLPDLPPGFKREDLPPEVLDRPSIFDALRQQLGLKLEAQKGPIGYFVIDSVEKPAGN
jgi:uncharacterized protein (TIGR03435 family)